MDSYRSCGGRACRLQAISLKVEEGLMPAEFRQFLGIALGSNFEVQDAAYRCEETRAWDPWQRLTRLRALGEEVSKMLSSFIQKLGSKASRAKLRAES